MRYATTILFCLGLSGIVTAQEEQGRPVKQQLKVTHKLQTKVQVPATDGESKPIEKHYNVEGIVRTASCGTYVEVTLNEEVHRYFPTNLNREMHVDGYAFRFDYVDNPSYDFPEDCNIEKSIEVNNVSPILNR